MRHSMHVCDCNLYWYDICLHYITLSDVIVVNAYTNITIQKLQYIV